MPQRGDFEDTYRSDKATGKQWYGKQVSSTMLSEVLRDGATTTHHIRLSLPRRCQAAFPLDCEITLSIIGFIMAYDLIKILFGVLGIEGRRLGGVLPHSWP
jgi:hypothetical protein